MQDLTFVRFERLAEIGGWLRDLGNAVSSSDAWESGAVHGSLVSGELVRASTELQILDPTFFSGRLDRLREFSRSIVELTSGDQLRGKSDRDRRRILEQAERAMWKGGDPASVRQIANVMSSLLSELIALRVVPCGRDRPELSFGGVLLDRADYLQREREALFSRFGSVLSGWTAVLQIETVPPRPEIDEQPDFSPAQVMLSEQRVNRAGAEKMCLDLLRFVDQVGLTEGPRWPSIAVTPLAIYRRLQTHLRSEPNVS